MAAVVFDLDGTLVDSAPDIRAAANRVLERREAEPVTLEQTISLIGSGARVFSEGLCRLRGLEDADALYSEFLAEYESGHALSRAYPGAVVALESLAGQGHRLAICTNKPEAPARSLLAALGLARFFEAIVGGDTLETRKPDPAPLRLALKGLPGPHLYVGDSEVDAATAAAAGVPFLLFTRGYAHVPAGEMTHAAAFDDHAALADLVAQQVGRAQASQI